jgi:hypothetical protein
LHFDLRGSRWILGDDGRRQGVLRLLITPDILLRLKSRGSMAGEASWLAVSAIEKSVVGAA